MRNAVTYVGLDVHKVFIQAAVLLPDREAPLELRAPNEPSKVGSFMRTLERLCQDRVELCYEAGVCGDQLSRRLNGGERFDCIVIAPSLIPRKPGDRIKTDRRDARKLGEYLRGGLLTEVRPPSPADEARRGLCRWRGAVKEDLEASTHRLSKFLLRHDRRFQGSKTDWTVAHVQWLRMQRLERSWWRT